MGMIHASEDGVVSAVRLWFVLEFGDADDEREGGAEGGGQGESYATTQEGGKKAEKGKGGQTLLSSQDTHWHYAVFYIPEASFQKGERVPLMCTRSGGKGGR